MLSYATTNLLITSPLEQFEILPSFFFIHSTWFLILSFSVLAYFLSTFWTAALWVPTSKFSIFYLFQVFYQEIVILIFRNAGNLQVAQLYFPWLFFVFLSILVLNIIGMIPYAFTLTSHIVVTFLFSFTIFMGINIRAMGDQKLKFFTLFLPSGAPIIIVPFLVIIELISYIARVFSLAIRLFANMMAGHTLLKILIGFAFLIASQNINTTWPLFLVAVIIFLLVLVITFLEVAIAFLQGYVFTVLLSLYIKDLYVAH